jgi:predicted GH43/DUF377 family glycosyl hydrolase
MYCATYTAYNGRAILPQFIETQDFLHFRVLTLNGSAVQNKGMALFPRRVNGRYAMLSRQDDENIFIMFSDNLHHWSNPQIILRPSAMWESVKIGNCGSPIETEAGWLVITHGVGPMRKYCIGAALLDLNDPTQGHRPLRDPLLSPEGNEREGYVPNVVYSCGSMLHGRELILPYAMSDKASARQCPARWFDQDLARRCGLRRRAGSCENPASGPEVGCFPQTQTARRFL